MKGAIRLPVDTGRFLQGKICGSVGRLRRFQRR